MVGPVESVSGKSGGFTPSVAALIRTSIGREAFVKAVDGRRFGPAAAMHREEAGFLQGLAAIPEVPQLLTWFTQDTWVVLVVEPIRGRHPELPWEPEQLDRVLEALARMSERLSPTPVAAPTVGERLGHDFDGWRQFRRDPGAFAQLEPAWHDAPIAHLADIEQSWEQAAAGGTLLHADLRADQLLLTTHGLRVVDWPHACVGAAWVDPLFFFPSVELQGGPSMEELVRRCALTAAAPRDQLITVAVAMAGYFLHRSTMPPPAGLPTVRSFQRAQGEVMARWLADLLSP